MAIGVLYFTSTKVVKDGKSSVWIADIEDKDPLQSFCNGFGMGCEIDKTCRGSLEQTYLTSLKDKTSLVVDELRWSLYATGHRCKATYSRCVGTVWIRVRTSGWYDEKMRLRKIERTRLRQIERTWDKDMDESWRIERTSRTELWVDCTLHLDTYYHGFVVSWLYSSSCPLEAEYQRTPENTSEFWRIWRTLFCSCVSGSSGLTQFNEGPQVGNCEHVCQSKPIPSCLYLYILYMLFVCIYIYIYVLYINILYIYMYYLLYIYITYHILYILYFIYTILYIYLYIYHISYIIYYIYTIYVCETYASRTQDKGWRCAVPKY